MAAWTHKIVNEDGSLYRELNDLDCLVISMRRDEMARSKLSTGIVYLADMEINLNTNQVIPNYDYIVPSDK